jgi:hypothetical protein
MNEHTPILRATAVALVALVLVLAAVLFGVGFGDVSDDAAAPTEPVATTVAPDPGDAPVSDVAVATVPTPQAPAPVVVADPPATPNPTTPPMPAGPRIVTFDAPAGVNCPGQPLHDIQLSWTTEHAVRTELSVDGPGLYDRYGPDATITFTFSCGGGAVPQSHTFLLRAFGANGEVVSKQITVAALGLNQP